MAYTRDMNKEGQKLSGFQRFQLTKLWRKTAMEEYPDKEQYIQAICEAKGLVYTPPIKVTRDISKDASMFPTKKEKV